MHTRVDRRRVRVNGFPRALAIGVATSMALAALAAPASAQGLLFANTDSRGGQITAFAQGAGPTLEDGYTLTIGQEFLPVSFNSSITAGTQQPNSATATLNTTSEWVDYDTFDTTFSAFTLSVEGRVSAVAGFPPNFVPASASFDHWVSIGFTVGGLNPGETKPMRLHGSSTGDAPALTTIELTDGVAPLFFFSGAGAHDFDEIVELFAGTYTLIADKSISLAINVGAGSFPLSLNVTLESPSSDDCIGDLTGSGTVGGDDLGALLNAWGPCPGCPEDLNGDGVVDGADLGLLLAVWGGCP